MAPDAPEREPEMLRYAAEANIQNYRECRSAFTVFALCGVQLGHRQKKNRPPNRKAV